MYGAVWYGNAGITKLEEKFLVRYNISGGNMFVTTNTKNEVQIVEGKMVLY